MDLHTLLAGWRQVIRDDARGAFTDMQRKNPDSVICSFALVTDEDGRGATPAADLQELREKRLAENRGVGLMGSIAYWLGLRFISLSDTAEWKDINSEDFRRSNPYPVERIGELEAAEKTWLKNNPNSVLRYRSLLLRNMVEALRELDDEGVFGRGEQRAQLTLFIDMTDSNLGPLLRLFTANMLNSGVSRQRLTRTLPLGVRATFHLVAWGRALSKGRLIARRTNRRNGG